MEKVMVEPFYIIGLGVKTTNADGKGAQDIASLWQKFMYENILEKIPNKVDPTIYCVYTDYEGDYTQPYLTLLGCKVKSLDEVPEGLTAKSFDGGSYLKMTAKGDMSQGLVINQWTKIWNMDLDRAYTADFEVFGQKAQNPADAEIDFFIAVNSFKDND